MNFILGFIYLIVTGAVLVSMAALFLRGKGEPYNRLYMLFQGTVLLWCSSQLLVLLAGNLAEICAAYLIGNIGICFVGAFWFYFAVSYTGKKLLGIWRYVPFFLSLAHYLLVLTNPLHGLYYSEFSSEKVVHGVFFYTNVAMTYTFVISGAVLLYRHMEKGSMAKALVVSSVLVPVAFNVIYLSGSFDLVFDITPLGFAVSIILMLLATVKYQFLDLRRELAITNEKLLLEKERNRIAQEVHDTAGHTLTMINSYVKLAQLSAKENDTEKTAEYLTDAGQLTSDGIRQLRESINDLRREAGYELVTQSITMLASQVKEIPVEVTVRGEDGEKYSHLSRVLGDTTREAITNALKYADASRIDIIIRFRENEVELVIGDDGKGCEEISENNGIRGIRERVKQAGGTVRFTSSAGEGFLINVKVPVE
jgi:signal transduction histidine kinase